MARDYIPMLEADFDEWFRNFEANAGPIATVLGIPVAFVTAVANAYADWLVKYVAHQTAQNAARSAAQDKVASRDTGKEAIRALAGMFQSHPDMTDGQRATLKLTVPDTEPTPRGKIADTPYINLKAAASGVIEVRSQTEDDPTRVSMHPLADGIECRYTIVPKGEMPPAGYADAKNTVVSRKARFTIDCGDKNSGDSFYGFFRWVNTSRSDNSGPWTKALHMVIA